MKLIRSLSVFTALAIASACFGQSATLTAEVGNVSAGSELTLTATALYAGTPAALGWSLTLPEGWSYVASTGRDVPAITPQAGATGTLEWAYTDAPANTAQFRVTLKAADKAGRAQFSAKVLLRAGGKQQAIETPPVLVPVASSSQ